MSVTFFAHVSLDTPPLEDESEWEHNRVIKQIIWWRRKGFAIETSLYGNVTHQSIQSYQINDSLHSMIRDSPHNTRRMSSQTSETFDSTSTSEDDTNA